MVVGAEPVDEFDDVLIAPHPRRKTFEAVQGFFGGRVVADALNVAVHAEGVGPVGFPTEEIEVVFGDEAFGDFGARVVELVRAVAGFAEEDEAAFASVFEEAIVVAAVSGEWVREFLDGFERTAGGDHRLLLRNKFALGEGKLKGGRMPILL